MTKNFQLIIFVFFTLFLITCQDSTKDLLKGVAFDEPDAPQPVVPVQEWDNLKQGVYVAWGSSNVRYHREYIPTIESMENYTCAGWKNERLSAQIVAWSKDTIGHLQIQVSDLKSEKAIIDASAIKHYYVRNVISDEFLGGCGYKTKKQETAHLVPDCLEETEAIYLRGNSARGIWLSIDIPQEVEAGSYKGHVIVKVQGRKVKTLDLTVNVQNHTLPNPKEWKYHLDLWQNPFAVARVHKVQLWSDEHFELMRPLYKMLANAGQKCITASILHKPWGGQTYDPFESMINHTLKTNGKWEFDYTIFDKWTAFMMDLGIDKQINCYSLLPWGNQLSYYDEEMDCDTFLIATGSSVEFAEYWIPFLNDFSDHMKQKGLFEITTIAMDERGMEDMQSAIELITKHGGFKITSAANYNPGISDQIYDLSVESRHILPNEVLDQRCENGQRTTFYVCCSAEYPNNFTYSPPAEGVWQAWYAYSKNLDGFLRWAYNSWVEDPIQDSRFRTWPAGDTYFVYPGAKSSIRFEKLREGIQDYEKLRIIVDELKRMDTKEAQQQLAKIEEFLNGFEIQSIKEEGALKKVLKGKDLISNIDLKD